MHCKARIQLQRRSTTDAKVLAGTPLFITALPGWETYIARHVLLEHRLELILIHAPTLSQYQLALTPPSFVSLVSVYATPSPP